MALRLIEPTSKHSLSKANTTCIVLWLFCHCNCLGLGKTVDRPDTKSTTTNTTNQEQTTPSQPSTPPYEEEKEENSSVDPTDLPPSYEEATAPPSYEEAINIT